MSITFRGIASLALVALLASCQDQITDPTIPLNAAQGGKPTPTPCAGLPSQTTGIILTPSVATVPLGGTLPLTATNQKGALIPACALKWSSSNTLVATVAATGVVTGIAAGGPVTIKAQTSGKHPMQGVATVTVDNTVATVEVRPSTATIEPGQSVQFTAIARNSAGREVTGKTPGWNSDNDAVARVSSTGLATGVTGGDAIITAQVDGKSGTGSVRVLGWRKLADDATTAAVATTSAFDPAGRTVFLAANNDGIQPDLWRLDLAAGTWTHVLQTNSLLGKYRQYQFDPSSGGRLLTFWDGLGAVFSIPTAGGAWAGLGGGGAGDAYYEGGSFMDPVTGRLSLLMGYGGGTHKNTFWQFDGASWILRGTSGTPPARLGPRLATDPSAKRVFLAGGHLNPSNNYTDVWSLDLNTLAWTNILPSGLGPQVISAFWGYVPSLNRLYVYGGRMISNGAMIGQTSAQLAYVDLASSTIVPVTTAGPSPGPRLSSTGAEFYYDAPSRRLIFGGGLDGTNTWHLDVWAYYLP